MVQSLEAITFLNNYQILTSSGNMLGRPSAINSLWRARAHMLCAEHMCTYTVQIHAAILPQANAFRKDVFAESWKTGRLAIVCLDFARCRTLCFHRSHLALNGLQRRVILFVSSLRLLVWWTMWFAANFNNPVRLWWMFANIMWYWTEMKYIVAP